MHGAGCVPNKLCEHQGLPKHDLMAPGFGSRFTNFSDWREGGGDRFGRVDYSASLKVQNHPKCLLMLF